LHPSDEADTSSGGDQLARNNLTGRNGKEGAKYPPTNPTFPFQPLMPKKTHGFVRSKKKLNMIQKKELKNQLLT
jgi:hypothetical protein